MYRSMFKTAFYVMNYHIRDIKGYLSVAEVANMALHLDSLNTLVGIFSNFPYFEVS